MRLLLISGLFLLFSPCIAQGQVDSQHANDTVAVQQDTVVKFKIHQKIGPAAWRKTKQAFKLVEKTNADHLLLHLNTYGGRVVDADSIKTRLLNAPVPVYVFIDPNAASAGALISIACSRIYMSASATMGAAAVVNQKGQKMPEKYQSYMRGTMRATSQARGRNPKIAEAMVDENIDLDGLAPKGELLTFTQQEAIKHGYCEGKVNTVKGVLAREGLSQAKILEPQISLLDKLITFLINPAFSSVLIMLMLGGLYFELQSPGLGFPIATAIIAAILYFAPLYLEDLAANWEIAVFVLGLILIGVELFILPGFGVAGISGLVMVFFSLVLSLIRNDFFDFTLTRSDDVLIALLTVTSSLVLGVILLLLAGKPLLNARFFQRLVLQDTLGRYAVTDQHLEKPDSQTYTPEASRIGAIGTAYTALYPSGKILIDDEMYDGVSEGEYIEKGQSVKVIRDYKSRLLVRPND